MLEKEERPAEVWGISAIVKEALRYVTFLYLEHISSILTSSSLYIAHTTLEKKVMYELKGLKLPVLPESLPKPVATALRIMKPEYPSRADIELGEQGQAVKSRQYPEIPVSCVMVRRRWFAW